MRNRLKMDVCYLGQFDPEYARNRTLIRGLRSQDINVSICRSTGKKRSLRRYQKLASAFKTHFRDVDLIIVGTPGNYDVPVAKYLSERYDIPFVFDAHGSAYDTQVLDRENVPQGSIRSQYYRLLDQVTCGLADTVLVDTQETRDFFISELGVSGSKIHAVPHGTDEQVFSPRAKDQKESGKDDIIWFHGNHIPLQGVQYIVLAAKKLEHRDITFRIVGRGQTYEQVTGIIHEKNIENVERIDWVDYEDLPGEISQTDLCLGIFGTSDKAGRVIPNKIYEYLAMKMPVITGRSPAMERVFDHGESLYLCERGSPDAIANATETVLDDETLRTRIVENGYNKYNTCFTTDKVGKRLAEIL